MQINWAYNLRAYRSTEMCTCSCMCVCVSTRNTRALVCVVSNIFGFYLTVLSVSLFQSWDVEKSNWSSLCVCCRHSYCICVCVCVCGFHPKQRFEPRPQLGSWLAVCCAASLEPDSDCQLFLLLLGFHQPPGLAAWRLRLKTCFKMGGSAVYVYESVCVCVPVCLCVCYGIWRCLAMLLLLWRIILGCALCEFSPLVMTSTHALALGRRLLASLHTHKPTHTHAHIERALSFG